MSVLVNFYIVLLDLGMLMEKWTYSSIKGNVLCLIYPIQAMVKFYFCLLVISIFSTVVALMVENTSKPVCTLMLLIEDGNSTANLLNTGK